MMRREPTPSPEDEDVFLDSAEQEKLITELRLQNAQSARTYSLALCLCALAHCLFALFLLLKHFLVAPFPPPLCVFEHPFQLLGMPGDVLALLLLSGIGCSAYMAHSALFIMRMPQRLAQLKLLGACAPSCSFSLSSRTWACVNAALWFMVAARTDVTPWNAPYPYCICLAPLAITYALYTLSNNVVKFDRSIDDLEGTKYEFKKL